MVLSEEDVLDLIADLERAKRELERAQQEKEAAVAEKELQKREYEAELEWLQYKAELEWFQSETVEMLMFPLLEGPEQSAPMTVALAAGTPAAEVMTGTRVFPDTAAPDASVERAAIELTSADPLAKSAARGGLSATTTAAGRSMIVTATATAAVTAVTAAAAVTAATTAAAAAATAPPATTAHDGIQPVW